MSMDRSEFRLASILLLVGVIMSFAAGILHPSRELPNSHAAVFAEYAASNSWTAIHLGQFGGTAVIVASLITLFFALGLDQKASLRAGRFGVVLSAISLALYAVLQAVDGVALKQAVDAWFAAPEAEKVGRFASAEAIRWLEWGVRSYESYVFGGAFIFMGIALVLANRALSAVGYLFALAGIAYLVQGWVLGSEGFSADNSIPTLAGYVFVVTSSVWMLVSSLRPAPKTDVPSG